METAEAREVLGIPLDADAEEERRAFRRLVRRHHPDLAGATGTVPTTRVLEAYRALRVARSAPVPAPATPAPARASCAPAASPVWAEGDTIVIRAHGEEAWVACLDVAHGLGEVAYLDGAAGLLETIVEFVHHPVCSVVLSFGAGTGGTTRAGCAVEALGAEPGPSDDAVAALVVERLRAHLG